MRGRRSLARLLLREEYYVQPDDKKPTEYLAQLNNGDFFISFDEKSGRFLLRGWIWYPEDLGPPTSFDDLRENGKYFEAQSTLGDDGKLTFKVPGDPLTSEFTTGDRTSISTSGREAVRTVFNGDPPANEKWQDIVREKHAKSRLVPTPGGVSIVAPRISNEEKIAMMEELSNLSAKNNEILTLITAFPGLKDDPEVKRHQEDIRTRMNAIADRIKGKSS